MLNYIWAGLIISSFLFAIGYDIRDLPTDRSRWPCRFPAGTTPPPARCR